MSIGTPDGIDELLEEYHAVLPHQLLHNETDSLLAALLMELKAQRISGGDSEAASLIIEQQRQEYKTDQEGVYHASTPTPDASDWLEVDLEFTASEIDLRNISGPIDVAFSDPGDGADTIRYDSTDSPIAGIGVRTSTVWFRADSGTESADLEAWM